MIETIAPTHAPAAPATRYTTGQVLSGFWRVLVGIKDALALGFLLLFFIALFGILSGTPNPQAFVSDGALLLRLDGVISEQPAPVDPFALLGGGTPMREFRRADVVHALETAASDDRIKAVVLDLDHFMGGGQVALGDVAAAIDTVRAAHKPVLAYATGYGDDAYQLAAHASEVWTENGGGVFIAGPGGSHMYYKGLIDRLGINAHVYRVGAFKSFVEPFTRTDQSPESREATLAYTNVLWEQWQQQVGRARPRATLSAYIADPAAAMRAANNDFALAAKNAGLVDRIGTRQQFERRIAAIAGVRDDDRPWTYNRIKLDDWVRANPVEENGERIAIVPVVGNIVDGRADAGQSGGESIAQHILDAVADDDVKAIVLRVDSPGGSVMASERIRSALLEAKARRLPIVVSMANVAASGGYWVSTPADRIFAEPDTITGSIGVFAIIPSFERTLGNIGITADGITTTPFSGQPDIAGGVSPAFDTLAQASVEQIYGRFTGLVAASRHLPLARVQEIAEGRVWAGATARQLGLVDQFGGLEDAIREAAKLAHLDPANVYPSYYEDGPDPFAEMIAAFSSPNEEDEGVAPAGWLAQSAWLRDARLGDLIGDLRHLMGANGAQVACVECGAALAPRAPAAQDRATIARWLGL
ncbi:MAG: signal peptide peptidase SppA [Sphingopyxis sp.]